MFLPIVLAVAMFACSVVFCVVIVPMFGFENVICRYCLILVYRSSIVIGFHCRFVVVVEWCVVPICWNDMLRCGVATSRRKYSIVHILEFVSICLLSVVIVFALGTCLGVVTMHGPVVLY